MDNMAWRAGVTFTLLVLVALAGLRTGQGNRLQGGVQAMATHPLPLPHAGDESTGHTDLRTPRRGKTGDPLVRVANVEGLEESSPSRWDNVPGPAISRVHAQHDEGYACYQVLPDTPMVASDCVALSAQRRVSTWLAQMPR